jgi:tetratricopeptide (TPR) repeat protein
MPTPICFMITPYKVKPTDAPAGKGPATVDFEALWNTVFKPLIERLGYRPVRADQDLGALIIGQMIERLALSDLVIAEVTAPNPNVYYEIGVRHAARRDGCILVSAEWAKQGFDLEQMRQCRYPLAEGSVTPATAEAALKALVECVGGLLPGASPLYEVFPRWPELDGERATSLENELNELSDFRRAVRAVDRAPAAERKDRARALGHTHREAATRMPGVATELLYLFQRLADWEGLVQLVEALPERIGRAPLFQEQYWLARAKLGSDRDAIAAYEQLIDDQGDTAERRGLIGGRYKALLKGAGTDQERAEALNCAIESYRQGMLLDLNAYYPSSNLPRLYRQRGEDGDEQLAREAAAVTLLACERAIARDPGDRWVRPTRLGAAFDAGDVEWARRLYREVRSQGVDAFSLQTTLPDLETAVDLIPDAAVATGLRTVLDDLRALLPPDAKAP